MLGLVTSLVAQVDVVEMSPLVVRMAEAHFGAPLNIL